ncbi:MAG: TIGR01777 family oxidoreductase [Candidatus Hydrogenedens sp.]|nr:TIGR01777 family oxidoreductase [Candidatus Hydrogenedens sp.]
MQLVISGASGFVGSRLYSYLSEQGHICYTLVRHQPKNASEIFWDPYNKIIDINTIKHADAFIHLSGANIADSFWTQKRKKILFDSRVKTTEFLAQSIVQLNDINKKFFVASAIGYYGANPLPNTDETGVKGVGFLSDLCEAWEKAGQSTINSHIKTVFMRFGVVMGGSGGFLQKMAKIYKWGLGGILGNEDAYISWIAIEDLCSAIHFLLLKENIDGIFNFVSPHPVTQKELATYLSKTLRRPSFLRVPSFILEWLLRDMGRELFLANQNIYPARLIKEGFQFSYSHLHEYIEYLYKEQML